jgi:hypothetical protein
MGHMPFGLHELLPPTRSNPRYFTMVRDPVARIVSEYYWGRIKGNLYPTYSTYGHATLQEFVTDDRFAWSRNMQTRMIAGEGAIWDPDKSTLDTLGNAFDNIIEWYDFVGRQEMFSATKVALMRLYGWPRCGPDDWFNASVRPPSPGVDAVLSAQIRERNQYDVMLYEWVVKRFWR